MKDNWNTLSESRKLVPEMMDEPDLDAGLHRAALAGLRRINRWSRTDAVLWQCLQPVAARSNRPLRVLDLACGGGDVLRSLAARAIHAEVGIEWAGCDVSPLALDVARQQSADAGVPGIRWFQHDVVRDGVPPGYDVTLCTLFLHHLSESEAESLLSSMADASPMVLVDDLVRTRAGYLLAWCGSRILTRSPVVRFDGPQSVRAAFSMKELRRLAEQSGLPAVAIRRHWPQRMLLTSERPQ